MSLRAEDIPTWADLSRKFIDQYQYCAETPPTLLELSTKEMAHGQKFEEYATKWRAQAAEYIPPISEVQQIQFFHSTLRGVYYSHLLAHTSSFSDLIEAGKKLDLGINLGRMEGLTVKGEESAKMTSATPTSSSGRRGKKVLVNAVNPAHPTSQQYSINYTPTPPVVPAYTSPALQYRPQPPSPVVHHYTLTRPQAPSIPTLIFESSSVATTGPTSAGLTGWCSTIVTTQTIPVLTDNCWKLRERIQEMIDAKELTFNSVRPPKVQANPLPDHGPSQGSSINMISIFALGEDKSEQGGPSPFVIEYVPAEATVGFAEIGTPPTPFVIDIPVRDPYSDDKVPWTYEGGAGNLEQQFSVMGVTRSGRVYENPAATNKGKAPTVESKAIPGNPSTPPKKVTKEEVEAFMKIIKASEYKIEVQMAKSPAHISLLALLLSSEPHREALLRVLTAA
ncbi:hypothetical protein CRG98_011142 [Punica granatum]|uniref:Retrotransposon gag domain-containing protein n=1 Tax=Punica granatum TaxID=22663 RepID=A0A2I0KJS0_PUNGR|nr:hypothetical protein CRG98_011142 [Punica granatum]